MDLTEQVPDATRAQILREEAVAAGGLTAQWMRQRADALDPRPARRFSLLEEIARGAVEYDALPECDRPILPRRRVDTPSPEPDASWIDEIRRAPFDYQNIPEQDRPIVRAR